MNLIDEHKIEEAREYFLSDFMKTTNCRQLHSRTSGISF